MFINSIKKVGWEVEKEQDTCRPRKGREHNWACKRVMREGFREKVMFEQRPGGDGGICHEALWREGRCENASRGEKQGAQSSWVIVCGSESWTIKKAECRRTDAFELWCWRRLLRVPWTRKRSNQSVLKEISPEYLLEKLVLKLQLH